MNAISRWQTAAEVTLDRSNYGRRCAADECVVELRELTSPRWDRRAHVWTVTGARDAARLVDIVSRRFPEATVIVDYRSTPPTITLLLPDPEIEIKRRVPPWK